MQAQTATIGGEIDRVEGNDKVTGRARYTADFAFANLVRAALVQSEIAHGLVAETSLRRNTEITERAPGVLRVLTQLNFSQLKVLPLELTDDLPLERRPPLSDLSVQHVGQHMAVVVADSPENATFAASLFKLDYEVSEPLLNPEAVLSRPDQPDDQDAQVRQGSSQPDHFVKLTDEKLQDRREGNLPNTPLIEVHSTYTTPRNAHYPIELSSTIASREGGRLTVHDSTGWIAGERRALAAYLGIAEQDVRVLAPLVGGAFGSKSFLWMHVALAAVAAREQGRPVKLVLTRDQMFSSTGHRPTTAQDIQLRAAADGRIESSEHHTLTETSTVGYFCEPAGLSTRFLYRSPRLVVLHRVARINSPTPCFMRGPARRLAFSRLKSQWTNSQWRPASTRSSLASAITRMPTRPTAGPGRPSICLNATNKQAPDSAGTGGPPHRAQ